MEIIHFKKEGVPDILARGFIALAVAEAPAMVHRVIGYDSPLLGIAQAEVEALLEDKLLSVGAGITYHIDGVLHPLDVGVVAALDNDGGRHYIAGFIQYQGRLLAKGNAVIGYAVVAKPYRGRGIFTQMLNELKVEYPALCLDCPLELVPMYEGLGFKVTSQVDAHVGMANLPISGHHLTREKNFLDASPTYQMAMHKIDANLGAGVAAAYAKVVVDTCERVSEVKALVAMHRSGLSWLHAGAGTNSATAA
jgi:GNAT superfamily N-acetyltransferase